MEVGRWEGVMEIPCWWKEELLFVSGKKVKVNQCLGITYVCFVASHAIGKARLHARTVGLVLVTVARCGEPKSKCPRPSISLFGSILGTPCRNTSRGQALFV